MSELKSFFRKRKVKKFSKNKKLKRAKIFEEKNFDSSSDESTKEVNLENSTDISDFEFRPSKSENEQFSTSEIVDLDSENENLNILTEKSFSDEDISYLNGSIVDCFRSKDDSQNISEIFSEQVVFENATKHSKKTDKKKTKIPNLVSIKSSPKEIDTFNEHEQLFYTNEGIILILSENEKVHIYGFCQLSVLHGEIEILGHNLTKNSPEVKYYSPRGLSLLFIQNITKTDSQVTNLNIPKKMLQKKKCAVILCKKFDDPQISFIEKHISQQIFPKEETHLPRVDFQPKETNFNLLRKGENWENVINFVDNRTKLMICGGKGVGKTTFLRYAINKLLMKFSQVRVIDLDPGQSEFAVPGCISSVVVEKPIFGPNFTHLQNTEKSILSNINIAYEPDKYVSSVKELLKIKMDDNIPTLINFMGYTHGIGVNILSAVITCVQPTDILQICSENQKKNYKFSLEKDVVGKNAKIFVREIPEFNYKLHKIESMSDKNEGWTVESRQLREMCILSYLSRMLENDSIFKIKAPLHKINLNDIILCDLKGDFVHASAINACLVALCALENQKNIFQCLGWGIVRGIDLAANELVLLSSEKMEILDQVTHLVSGGVTLPPSIYMTPDEMVGHIPYVMEGILMSFGQIPKRSRISAKNVINNDIL